MADTGYMKSHAEIALDGEMAQSRMRAYSLIKSIREAHCKKINALLGQLAEKDRQIAELRIEAGMR